MHLVEEQVFIIIIVTTTIIIVRVIIIINIIIIIRVGLCVAVDGTSLSRLRQEIKAGLLHLSGTTGDHNYRDEVDDQGDIIW